METPPEQHEPKTDLKYLFRNFVSIIMFCVDEAEKEMREIDAKKAPPCDEKQKEGKW